MDEAKQRVLGIIHAVARGDERYWMEARFIPRRVRWDVVEADLRQVFEGVATTMTAMEQSPRVIALEAMNEAFATAKGIE